MDLLSQVEKQIDQMVRFIKQEAEEKSAEIRVSAEEVGIGYLLTFSVHVSITCTA